MVSGSSLPRAAVVLERARTLAASPLSEISNALSVQVVSVAAPRVQVGVSVLLAVAPPPLAAAA